MASQVNVARASATGSKSARRQRRRTYSWYPLHTVECPLIKREQLDMVVVPDGGIEPDGNDMVPIKTGVKLREIPESSNEQACSDQQYKRERKLQNHQALPQGQFQSNTGFSGRPYLQRLGWFECHSLPSGSQSEKD